jgi:hypothetical protein
VWKFSLPSVPILESILSRREAKSIRFAGIFVLMLERQEWAYPQKAPLT